MCLASCGSKGEFLLKTANRFLSQFELINWKAWACLINTQAELAFFV